MIQPPSFVYFALTALLITSVAHGAADDKETEALRQVVASYFTAIEKRDTDALDRLLGKQFSFPGGDRQAFLNIQKALFPKLESSKYKINIISVTKPAEPPVRIRVDYVETIKPKGGEEHTADGSFAFYLDREGDAWKIAVFRNTYVDVLLNVQKKKTPAERLAAFQAEGDDFLTGELLVKLNQEQAVYVEQGDYATAVKLQEFAEEATAAIKDENDRDLQTGFTYLGRGKIAERQSQYKEATGAFQKSLAAFKKNGARTFEVSVMSNLGIVLRQQGNFKEALQTLEDARKILSELNEFAKIINEAKLLGNIGQLYSDLGNYSKAIPLLTESERLARKFNDRETELNARLNMATIQMRRGQLAEAIKRYEEIGSVFAAAGLRAREGLILNNLGIALLEQGRPADALRRFEAAQKIAADLRDRRAEAMALTNLAMAHSKLHSRADTERYMNRALDLFRAIGDLGGMSKILVQRGQIHMDAKDLKQAENDFRESLDLAKKIGAKDMQTQSLLFLALVHEAQGEPGKAADEYLAVIALYRELGDPFREALVRAKRCMRKQPDGRFLVDLEELDALAEVARKLDDPRFTIRYQEMRSQMYLDQERWKEAAAAIRTALTLEEKFRSAIEDPLLKASSSTGHSSMFINLAVAQERLGDIKGVFETSESAKARSLLEMLESGRAGKSAALSDREATDEQQLREAVSAAARMYHGSIKSGEDPEQRKVLKDALAEVQARYDEFRRKMVLAHPELRASQGAFSPIDPAKAQERFFKHHPDAAIVCYIVGKTTTLIIVLMASDKPDGPANITVHRLKVTRTELSEAAAEFQTACRDPERSMPDTSKLWNWLIAPAAKQLEGKKRIVFVPDEPLLTFPFQALRKPEESYLIQQYAISYAPSVTALVEMMDVAERRRSAKSQPADLIPALIVGRPKYDKDLKDLPATEAEAKTLNELFGPQSRMLLGSDATVAAIRKEAPRACILHFATHGLVNETRPLFSALAFTPTGAGDDGRLYAHDVMNMRLNADLVVLSACDTGRGREYAGEGVLGLSWAFFAAGSPCCILSQWSVADASSSRLMQLFHQRLKQDSPLNKYDALREAQLTLLKDRATRHPFHWAPFVLVGDGR